MILELQNWYLGYSQILTDCRKGSPGSVLLLCNADVDAMAAARILTYMFRNDGITYQLLPCMSYNQLNMRVNDYSDADLRAVVLLNLGATRNLTRLLEAWTRLVKVYIMDCRRPVHLANIHAGGNVVVFWDTQLDEVPSDGDNLSGDESSSEDEDSETSSQDEGEHEFDDEEEKEFEDSDNDISSRKFRGTHEDQNVDSVLEQESDYDAEDEFEGDAQSSPKRRRTIVEEKLSEDLQNDDEESLSNVLQGDGQLKSQLMTPKELHRDRRDRVRRYYSSGSYYGSPAAFVAYTVSTQLRFQDVGDLLWLACVGVTDAYLHSRLDVSGYSTLALQLRNACNRLFPTDFFDRIENTVYAEDLLGLSSNDSKDLTKIGFSDNGRILAGTDYRFFLLRHTSLFDAMVYSDYISTRFQLSTSRGMHRLQEMLAKMGFPLEECRQPFAFMKPSLRRRLREQIEKQSEEYGLENIAFTSFLRITGYQSLLSASDTSYAVTALLECDPKSKNASANAERNEDVEMIEAFNLAYDALNAKSSPSVSLNGLAGEGNNLSDLVNGGRLSGNSGLGAGIRLAMKLQRYIMATAASLVARSAITFLSHFRYAFITCTNQGENRGSNSEFNIPTQDTSDEEKHHVFARPLALSRLAHYLMDLHRENGKWTGPKARPLILLAEKPRTKTFIIVGYEYPERAGNFVKNRFGKNFEIAAQSMKGNFRFDSFDSNVVEVDESDAQRFIEQLHYLMDSAE